MTAIRRWLSKSGTAVAGSVGKDSHSLVGHVLPVRAAGRRIRSARTLGGACERDGSGAALMRRQHGGGGM